MHTRAPFTKEQVLALKEYQNCGLWHPYTCCQERMVPETKGLWCVTCGKYQEWAINWTTNLQKVVDSMKASRDWVSKQAGSTVSATELFGTPLIVIN